MAEDKMEKISTDELGKIAGGVYVKVYTCDVLSEEGLPCQCYFNTYEALAEHKKIGDHQFTLVKDNNSPINVG